MVAAHCLFSRPLPIQSDVASGKKEIYFIQDGSKIVRQKNIDYHGLKPIAIICHLRTALISHWSLPLKGLSHEIDFKNFVKNLQNLA